jgi:hypothetical protein
MTNFQVAPGAHDPIADEVAEIIRYGDSQRPRSQQQAPGPSTLGNTCDRALAYHARRTRGVSKVSDPLMAIIGTAMHAWMEYAVDLWNKKIGQERYLTERKVKFQYPDGTEGSGTADCFDTERNLLIDWKVLGKDSLATIQRGKPSEAYKTQTHLYGMGYTNEGYRVDQVCLVGIPRSGRLSEIAVWREDYDPSVAKRALERYEALAKLPEQLGVEEDETRWGWIPTGANPACHWCRWYRPGEPTNGSGCAGA